MVNPLTEDEINQCFEILQVINADSAEVHNGFGITLYISNLDVLMNQVRARLTALSDSKVCAIRAILCSYAPYRFNFTTIEGGSAGSTSGISDNPAVARAGLKVILQSYIPDFHIAEAKARNLNTQSTPSAAVPILGRS